MKSKKQNKGSKKTGSFNNDKKVKSILVKVLSQVAVIGVTAIITALITRQVLLPETKIEISDGIVAEASEQTSPVASGSAVFGTGKSEYGQIKDQEALIGPLPRFVSFDDIMKQRDIPKELHDSETQKALKDLLKEHPEAGSMFLRCDEYPEGMLAAVCQNHELLEFAMAYPDAKRRATGGFTDEELKAEHPHYLQFDTRWGFAPYGKDVIGICGCAPTAYSMVVLELTRNEDVTPDVVADYCMEHNLYIDETGTDWSLYTGHGEEFGIQGTRIDFKESEMIKELSQGHPIILSLGPGDFTKKGHIIVVVDYIDGKFAVSDPGSTERSNKLWSFEQLIPQVKNLWSFKKAGY